MRPGQRRLRTTLAIVVALTAGTLHSARAEPLSGPAVPPEPTLGPLISGAVSRIGGSHVWTDYAYDDRGANASSPTADPAAATPGSNAADLIQLQLRPTAQGLGITAVLETLTDPAVPSLGVGIDTDGNPATGAPGLPGAGWTRAGDGLGLDRAVVVDHAGYRVLAWSSASATWTEVAHGSSQIDPAQNTVRASVPAAALGTTGPVWRVVGVLGLAVPGSTWTDGTGAIYDLAYVREPSTDDGNFQSATQAAVLSGSAPAATAVATIDRSSLATDSLADVVPGFRNTLLYRSRLDLGEGLTPLLAEGDVAASLAGDGNRRYAGPYQPYVLWFPETWDASVLRSRQPLITYLHGAGQTHLGGSYGGGGYITSTEDLGLGQGFVLGPGSIDPDAVIVTPLGRGEGNPNLHTYDGPAEQDVLDVIADVERRFSTDPDRLVLTGYSLGGVGTFRLAQLYPDRFAGAVEIVGAPDLGVINLPEELQGQQRLPNQLENLRNLPFRMAHARADELETVAVQDQPDRAAVDLLQLGYDFRYWEFYERDHVTFPVAAVQCEMELAIQRGREHDPARVVYSQEPAIVTDEDPIGLHLHHDAAYWMTGMVVRGTSFAPGDKGTVDITNLARADRAPLVTSVLGAGENITAGRDVCGDNPEVRTGDVWSVQGLAWSAGLAQPMTNAVSARLTRVAQVTVHLDQMRGLDVTRPFTLQVSTDGPTAVQLLGAWPRAVQVTGGATGNGLRCPVGGLLDLGVDVATTSVSIVPVTGPAARVCRAR